MMGVKGRKRKQREIMYDCVFVGPALIIFLIFVLSPFLMMRNSFIYVMEWADGAGMDGPFEL